MPAVAACRALGEERLFGREVVHVGAIGRAGERELVAEVGLQPGQAAAGGSGGWEQQAERRSPQSRISSLARRFRSIGP